MRGVFLDLATVDRGDLDRRSLEEIVDDWTLHDAPSRAPLAEQIGDAEVVVTNKQRLDRPVLEAAPNLELICVAATGTDNIDLAAARELGVAVCNARGYCTAAVTQHVLALILALNRRLVEHRDAVRAGAWSQAGQFALLDYPFGELSGRVLGIVGHGELGSAVARLGEALGMDVRLAARPGGDDRTGRVPLTELLAEADVLSLHCPLTDTTRGLIGADELARMKPEALLINTARGALVDSRALVDALAGGRPGGAGVDVLPAEPPPADDPLVTADLANLIVTPHVAWASREARQRVLEEIAANIRAHRGGEDRNRVA